MATDCDYEWTTCITRTGSLLKRSAYFRAQPIIICIVEEPYIHKNDNLLFQRWFAVIYFIRTGPKMTCILSNTQLKSIFCPVQSSAIDCHWVTTVVGFYHHCARPFNMNVNKPIISTCMLPVNSHNARIPHTTTRTTTELQNPQTRREKKCTREKNHFHSVPTAAKYP